MGSRAVGHRLAVLLCAFGLSCATVVPAAADDGGDGVQIDNGQCNFPSDMIKGTPWSLQRVLLDEMWDQVPGRGRGVKVAVIDTGVDNKNPQLRQAIAPPDANSEDNDLIGEGDGTTDLVGHGTKVAGIIAARPVSGTGFVGIASGATIIPIRQNDNEGNGTVGTLVKAIDRAIEAGADVINISQDTTASLSPGSELEQAVQRALKADIVVIAAAGNDGASGEEKKTYPASFPGVLAVAASDRNNERAPFSQPGDFVGIAAPGVDMVSTVPGGGHCIDNGTSFAAPYVAGVAALVRAKHPQWSQAQVVAQLQQTAERTGRDRNNNIGWGVVDPVAALTDDDRPISSPTPDPDPAALNDTSADIQPAALTLTETPQERRVRYAVYVVGSGLLIIAMVVGSGIAIRDWRRKNGIHTQGEALHG